MQGRRIDVQHGGSLRGFIPAHAGAAARAGRAGPWPWVHPCPCRGGDEAVHACCAHGGSSLPMQGRRFLRVGPALDRGFIPAHAGAAPAPAPRSPVPGVHPCPCRGGTSRASSLLRQAGSSLPMQGRLEEIVGVVRPHGFIPAHAGAAGSGHPEELPQGVHPCPCRGGRARADKTLADEGSSLPMQGRHEPRSFLLTLWGSSLPMQGRRCHRNRDVAGQGFIPAHAGAARRSRRRCHAQWVHPCPCRGGELDLVWQRQTQGSSLPMQGRHGPGGDQVIGRGFIPAHAGAAVTGDRTTRRKRVHPCPCRGGLRASRRASASLGSSLPMQGRQRADPPVVRRQGFIPAHAGAASWPPGSACGAGVHPCPCRGGQGRHPRFQLGGGSSLPMQGRRWRRCGSCRPPGFIPAHAGAAWRGSRTLRGTGVHPCPCRGGVNAVGSNRAIAGSSLPMQGRLHHGNRGGVRDGFIPAHAGAAATMSAIAARARVHPCPCRGGSTSRSPPGRRAGSSLPMQGRRLQ